MPVTSRRGVLISGRPVSLRRAWLRASSKTPAAIENSCVRPILGYARICPTHELSVAKCSRPPRPLAAHLAHSMRHLKGPQPQLDRTCHRRHRTGANDPQQTRRSLTIKVGRYHDGGVCLNDEEKCQSGFPEWSARVLHRHRLERCISVPHMIRKMLLFAPILGHLGSVG